MEERPRNDQLSADNLRNIYEDSGCNLSGVRRKNAQGKKRVTEQSNIGSAVSESASESERLDHHAAIVVSMT